MSNVEYNGRTLSPGNAAQRRFGLHQYWPLYGDANRLSIDLTGNGRDALLDRLETRLHDGHPHALALFGMSPKTVVHVSGPLEARALYCEIEGLLTDAETNRYAKQSLARFQGELADLHDERRDETAENERNLAEKRNPPTRGAYRPPVNCLDLETPLTETDDFERVYTEWVQNDELGGRIDHTPKDPIKIDW